MTSPGSNQVEIRVVAIDQTGPGFDSATKRAKGLAQAVAGGSGSAASALKEAEKQATGLGATLKRVGEVAGGVLVANAVQAMAQRAVQLVKSTAQAASALGESVNAVEKVFGDASAEIKAFGETSAESAGLSTRAFNQMATPLGAMLKNSGLAMQDVTKHTIELTKRAADMGSVFDTDVADVLAAIQAGLRGEIDPLERFGVSLSAAAVEARALADSGKESAKELTAQEKALARLNILYDQTADTAGDFADTADSLANSQRRASAQIENAQAQIGTTFMPILAKAAQLSGELAESFGKLPAPLQLVAAGVIGLGAAFGLLAPKVLAAKAALDTMAASDSKMQRGAAKSAKVMAVAGAGLAAFTVAAGIAAAALHDELNPQIDALAGGMQEWAEKGKLAGEAARLFGEDSELLARGLQSVATSGFSQTMDDLAEGIPFVGATVSDARERVRLFDDQLAAMVRNGNAKDARALLEEMARQAGVSVDEIMNALPAYSGAMETGARKTSELGGAAEEAARDLDELRDEMAQIINDSFAFEEAQDKAADAVQRLKEQIDQQRESGEAGAGTLDRNTQAGRDNADAARELVRIYNDLMVQAQQDGRAVDGLRRELEDQLTAMFGSRQEAQRYVAQLYDLEQQLAQIKSKEIEVKIRYNQQRTFTGGGVQEYAHGGIVGGAGQNAATGGVRGGPVTVNEDGPELARVPSGDVVSLPHGSTVIPHGQSMAMLNQPAAPAAQPVQLYGGGLGQLVWDWLEGEARRRGLKVMFG